MSTTLSASIRLSPASLSTSTPLTFTGSLRQYVGLWMVNLLLSIVTLGIYSAWAKVRRKKFFYQHTHLAGVSFDYHARPIAILKGRMIAVALLLIYQLLAKTNPLIAVGLFLLLSIAVPWLLVRSLTFNARNSSYRGLRFDFFGSHLSAAKMFIFYPLLAFLTLGTLYPWIKQRVHTFIINHHRYGQLAFVCEATVAQFYRIYLWLLASVIALIVMLVLLSKSVLPTMVASRLPAMPTLAQQAQGPSRVNFIQVTADQKSAVFDHASESQPATNSRMAGTPARMSSLMLLLTGAYLILFTMGLAYLNSRIGNLLWNHTRIANAHFSSHLRMRDLVWIYATNFCMLLVSFGLATPVAQLRATRYRIQSLRLHGIADWDSVVAAQQAQLRATSEEVAEMFDVDVSFG